MSKKLPKYKKDALQFLLDWANNQCNIVKGSPCGYTKLVYSEEHACITFYPNAGNSLPELEVGLERNVKGRIKFTRGLGGKVVTADPISDEQVAKLSACVSQVLQKVPFTYKGKYGNERPIGFHYSTYHGVLSVMGSYNNQYMYPKA